MTEARQPTSRAVTPSPASGRYGAAITSFLIPAFVKVMMDHPGEPWGANYYPVVE